MEEEEKRFILTQEHIDMLQNRAAMDAEFKAFMEESLADRKSIRGELAANTRTINEVHTALFAKDDSNEFGITGLVTNMQAVVRHTEIVCNFARFCRALIIGALGMIVPALAGAHYLGWI